MATVIQSDESELNTSKLFIALSSCVKHHTYNNSIFNSNRSITQYSIKINTLEPNETGSLHQSDSNINFGLIKKTLNYTIILKRRNENKSLKDLNETNKPKTKKNQQLNNSRFIVNGTTRFAFGMVDDVRAIYRLPKHITEPATITHTLENETLLIQLDSTAENRNENQLSDKTQIISSDGKIDQLNKNENNDKKLPSNSMSTTFNDDSSRNKVKSINNDKPFTPLSYGTHKIKVGNVASNNSANKGKSFGLGVGVGGRSAALAKMAALGQDWPEEEDLPSLMKSESSLIERNGIVNNQVRKEVQITNQRQGKLKSAKRNG
eukprot:gene14406-19337_t